MVWLSLIILLGLGLRLTGLLWGQAYCYFGQADGVEAYSVAVDYGLGTPRALYIGQPNYNEHSKLPGPLWTVFCFICCRLWGSIEGVVIGTILLNTAVIYLIYLLASRTIGSAGALWAALFTATSPWVVYYSVGVYNPSVMSFLSSLLFLALWQASRIERARSIFWVPLLLLAMLQFHMSGLMLFPAVVIVLALCPARVNTRWLLAGVVAGLALYLPYVCGEIAHGWQNTRGMFGGGGKYTWDGLKAVVAPLSFLVNWAHGWTRSVAEYRELGRACFGSFEMFLAINLLSAVVAGFVVTGTFLEIWKALRGGWRSPRAAYAQSPGVMFLAILFLVPLMVALAGGKAFHTRYCIVLLPAMLPLAAVAALHWLDCKRVGRNFRLMLVLTCLANVWLMPAMYHYQGMQIEKGPVLIPSFRKLETIYQSLKTHAGANSVVQVDVMPYFRNQAIPPDVRHDAAVIWLFVQVREKESQIKTGTLPHVAYRLFPEAAVRTNDPMLAYRGNGIALVGVPPVR